MLSKDGLTDKKERKKWNFTREDKKKKRNRLGRRKEGF